MQLQLGMQFERLHQENCQGPDDQIDTHFETLLVYKNYLTLQLTTGNFFKEPRHRRLQIILTLMVNYWGQITFFQFLSMPGVQKYQSFLWRW